ncbi:MAG TPA: pyridoxal-phosphate dependent enzyme [Saprospiraceae bacterium]|nr:pyridoxal-phosphate dependent enzyme [Saprospiraceae bacterium]
MWNLEKELMLPSPLVSINLPLTIEKNIHLYIKREDLIHPWVSGNKWRKLKYNLDFALQNNIQTIITFGGAFSNHLYATAGACALLGIKSIGIIRGEIDHQNPTLKFCLEKNMTLIPMSRSAYRDKEASKEIQDIIQKYPDALVIPEGGTNQLALKGVGEIWDEINYQLTKTPHYITLSAGTGGTTAGLLSYNNYPTQIISFSALKSDHLEEEILSLTSYKNKEKLNMVNEYHFGGYGKWTDELIQFISDFESMTGIPLDHVYNGKAVYGLLKMIEDDYFPQGTTIVHVHTGGLQGLAGLEYMRK